MAYANRAPKGITVLVAVILMLVGAVLTFTDIIGDGRGDVPGVIAYVLADVVLLLGVFLRRL